MMAVAISDTDIKALFRLCASQTSSAFSVPPTCLELASGTGVILEETAKAEIEARVIGKGDGTTSSRTSIFQIASELQLDPKAVEPLLPVHLPQWGRVGVSEIITAPEFCQLQEIIYDNLMVRVVRIPEFCRRNKIDVDLFRRLLPAVTESWEWLGNDRSWIYSLDFYNECKTELSSTLAETVTNDRPVAVSTLSSDDRPSNFIWRIMNDLTKSQVLHGVLENGEYVPDVYITKRQEALVDELRTEGLLSLGVLISERIQEPKKFIEQRLPTARLLDEHFVTTDFISDMEEAIRMKVQEHGWSGVKDAGGILTTKDKAILRRIITKDIPGAVEVADKIVFKDLEDQLADIIRTYTRQQAEAAWKSRSKNKPTDFTLRTQELAKYLSSSSELKKIPLDIVAYYVDRLQSRAVSLFLSHRDQLRSSHNDVAKSIFVDKFYSRFLLNYSALRDISDTSLRTKLDDDLLAFARESGVPAIDRLESGLAEDEDNDAFRDIMAKLQASYSGKAEQQLREIEASFVRLFDSINAPYPNDKILMARRNKMMAELNTQLQETKDASLMLLLVLILMHARASQGVLRASGKFVPKLLKELQSTGKITDTQAKFLNNVKSAIVQKKQVEDSEIQQLKHSGQQCMEV